VGRHDARTLQEGDERSAGLRTSRLVSNDVKQALLDTSFVIAIGRGEEIAITDPPEEAAISAVTLCGLHHGVLIATDEQRPGRLATLAYAERRFAVLPVDARVAPHYGRLLAGTRRRGARRLGTTDALIAATAAARHLPLIIRDRDFANLDGVDAVVV
jgi:predicted nucleic acid-binding protein